jgi:hypothetical protein
MRPLHLAPALLVLFPAVASAHITMTFPSPRTAEQKLRHCGDNVPRANVSTFLPGQTITVTWLETINHTGWYRISFHPDGDTFRIPPMSDGPCEIPGTCAPCVGATCNFPTEDMTGMLDPGGSGSTIIADRIPDGMLSYDITLPNIECTNCTLQLIQLMTEGHGDYNEDPNEGNDIYFQCADVVLSATTPDAGPSQGDAQPGGDAFPSNDAGDMPGDGGGCCSAGGTGPTQIALGAIVLGLVLRRRRCSPR